ncbi:MAG: hypothetical protein KME31_05380 [Tolypothrix carrinoi HA7290-LM1]|nr:hypothetical protein [Tolypothrix carrinoi HA7290-LM1]
MPCPPFSRQGRRKAEQAERDRFPDLLRVVVGCRPRWVIIESKQHKEYLKICEQLQLPPWENFPHGCAIA